jgi:hypothetical protein
LGSHGPGVLSRGIVGCDAGALECRTCGPQLMAAFSKVSYARGTTFPLHTVCPWGSDLSMACVLLDTPERTLILWLCRTRSPRRVPPALMEVS